MLSQNFSKKFYQKRFAISRAWMGSGGEVYIGAEGLREGIGEVRGEGSGKRRGVAMRKQELCGWM